jgi:hypothetical protein
MASNLFLKAGLLLVCFTAGQHTQAQEVGKHALDYTYAPGSPTYWRNTHSTRPGNFVFRRDPNVWVYRTEVAQRVGMPLEWASDELKGVAAAAFRMERDGAEEDCGWGGNPKACKPLVRCVLELYFDRQAHPLPWAPNRIVADFYWQDISTAYHFLPSTGWGPGPNGDVSRGVKSSPNYPDLSRQPFADPQTGDELIFASIESDSQKRVLAYDKEIHGRYAFVRLSDGCGRPAWMYKTGQLIRLVSKENRNTNKSNYHDVFLPVRWVERIRELTTLNRQQDEEYYKGIWNNLNSGEKK